jgi:GNAT superfamily N-acetyltransferase
LNDLTIRSASRSELDLLVAIDEDAAELYAQSGIPIVLPPEHPFSVAERKLWSHSLEQGFVSLALDGSGSAVGFAALSELDGVGYLDQLSVRLSAMRRGVGGQLLEGAIDWARARHYPSLTLTTYDHLPFNRPFYERRGFLKLAGSDLAPGLAHHLEEQRRHLPAPHQRIAMRLIL